MTVAMIPGSFDPMTLGHRFLVTEALKEYDKVVVAMMVNPEKKYLFSKEERLEFIRLTLAGLDRVEVTADDGYTADLYAKIGASAAIKGYRNEADYAYEWKMAEENKKRNPEFKTVLIASPKTIEKISSTEVKSHIHDRDFLYSVLEKSVADRILNRNKA